MLKPHEAIYAADRLIAMSTVLARHGIPTEHLPTQLRCPIHSGGHETRPSARVYAEDKTLWCYTCSRQYTPTQVEAYLGKTTQEQAAAILLETYSPPREKIQQLALEATKPKQRTLPQEIRQALERRLITHRQKVPLSVYRSWVHRLDDFVDNHLLNLDNDMRSAAIQAFLLEMDTSMKSP